MLTVILIAIAAFGVFAVAAVVVGREARRLSAVPIRAVVSLDDAVMYVAERLPYELTARLSHDDVALVLSWHSEYLAARGISGKTADPVSKRAIASATAIGGEDALAYVIGKADAAGADIEDADIGCILDLEVEYLEAIGALGESLGDVDS